MENPLTTAEAVAAVKVHLHTIGGSLACSLRWRSLADTFDDWRIQADARRLELRRQRQRRG